MTETRSSGNARATLILLLSIVVQQSSSFTPSLTNLHAASSRAGAVCGRIPSPLYGSRFVLPTHSQLSKARQRSRQGLLCLRAADEVQKVEDLPFLVLQSDDGRPAQLEELPDEWNQGGVYAMFSSDGQMQYVAMSRKVAVSISNHLIVLGKDDCYAAKAMVWPSPSKADLENTAKAWIEACIEKTGAPPPGNTKEVVTWRMKASDVRRAKQNIQFTSGATKENAAKEIEYMVKKHPVVLFMKGTRGAPQCGFSEATIAILDQIGMDYECVDCLDEQKNPGLREAIKLYSDWPTIPQLYASGEFIGGADIVREMEESGELKDELKKATSTLEMGKYLSIYPEEVHKVMMNDAEVQFVDCRTEPEHQDSRVPGSVNIPAFLDTPNGRVPVKEAFVAAIKRQYPDRKSKLVLGCQRGVRSKAAAEWLCEEGYTQLLEMEGGFALWASNAQLPVSK